MKNWAMKNLASLMSVVGAAVYALIVIVITFGVGYGAKNSELVLITFDSIKSLNNSGEVTLATLGLVFGIVSIIPVAIRLILGLLGINVFARLFNLATIALGVISVILLVVLNIQLLGNDALKVSVGSVIGFYILLFIGLSVITGPIVKK